MKQFAITFGQQYRREPHTIPFVHPDGWILIEVDTMERARHLAYAAMGTQWSNIYDLSDLESFSPGFYERGQIGTLRMVALPTPGRTPKDIDWAFNLGLLLKERQPDGSPTLRRILETDGNLRVELMTALLGMPFGDREHVDD